MGGGEWVGTLDIPMVDFLDVKAAQYCQDSLRTRDRTRPFLLIPAEFGLRYRAEDSHIWPNLHDPLDDRPFCQRKVRLRERRYKYAVATGDEVLRALLAYNFSYVAPIDQLIGDSVATFKEQGLYETTAIFVTADHGDMAGSHGFLSKGAFMYDEIYRTPLVLRPAGGTAPKRVAAPVHLMDVTATLLNLMSGSVHTAMGERPLHGETLLPFATGEANWSRKVHYAEYHGDWNGHYSSPMVTDDRWKLVWNLTDRAELYSLADDPAELHNRFYDPAAKHVRDHYFSLLVEEGRRLGDGQLANWRPEVEYALVDDVEAASKRR